MRDLSLLGAIAMLIMLTACGSNNNATPTTERVTAEDIVANPEIMHARLRSANPAYKDEGLVASDQALGLIGDFSAAPIKDISGLRGLPFNALDFKTRPISNLEPLKGMELKLLGIEETTVADLSPLKGMPIEKLYLSKTPVRDISALKGMPLQELMLVETQVSDITPLEGAPLQSLWLNSSPVTDIRALAKSPLVSLTLEGTQVSDLTPLANVKTLDRLHFGETPVTDVMPLKDLKLTRIVLNPANITTGMEVLRDMSSITSIGTTLIGVMPPAEFWSVVDRAQLGDSQTTGTM